MTDYTLMFHNDWFNITMVTLMSPIELYFYRQTSKYIYSFINDNMLLRRIVNGIKNRLKYIYADKYNLFMELLTKRKMKIIGSFINEVIWNEYHDITNIILYMPLSERPSRGLEAHGSKNNNVFSDYKKIDSSCTYNSRKYFNESNAWIEPEAEFILNGRTDLKVELHIDFKESGPNIFHNNVKCDDNNKLTVKIKDINAVMHKIEVINTMQDFNNFDYICYHDDMKKLIDKYNVRCQFLPLGEYITDESCKIPLIVYNTTNKFTLFNHCFTSTEAGCLKQSIKLNNNDYIDVNMKITSNCDSNTCPFQLKHNFQQIEHFHGHIQYLSCNKNEQESEDKLLLNNILMDQEQEENDLWLNTIILIHKDIPIFDNHTHILNSNILDDMVNSQDIFGKYYFSPYKF